MSISVHLTQIFRVTEVDGFGAGARTTVHRIATLQGSGITRHDSKLLTLSAGLSLMPVDLSPVTPSAPGHLLWFQANQPVDLYLGGVSGAPLVGVRSLLLAADLSSVYVTTVDSGATILLIEALGGGSVQVNQSFT